MILIFTTIHGQGHGAEELLCQLMRSWPAEGEELALCSPAGSRTAQEASALGLTWMPFPAKSGNFIRNFRSARTLSFPESKPRLVHAWEARSFETALYVARKHGLPCTGTLQDHPHSEIHGQLRRRIMRTSANRFQGLVCVSESLRLSCLSAGYRTPLRTILNGIAPFSIEREPGGDKLRIGFLGMNSPRKGFEVVDQWIRAEVLNGVEWHLYGDPCASLQEPLARLQRDCPKQLKVSGRLSVFDIFGRIDILVHPALRYEPFGLVVLEAANCRIPVLASRCGGPEEIIRHGETGYLFDVGRPDEGLRLLKNLVASPDLCRTFGEAASNLFLEDFGAERMARQYREFWAQTPA